MLEDLRMTCLHGRATKLRCLLLKHLRINRVIGRQEFSKTKVQSHLCTQTFTKSLRIYMITAPTLSHPSTKTRATQKSRPSFLRGNLRRTEIARSHRSDTQTRGRVSTSWYKENQHAHRRSQCRIELRRAENQHPRWPIFRDSTTWKTSACRRTLCRMKTSARAATERT